MPEPGTAPASHSHRGEFTDAIPHSRVRRQPPASRRVPGAAFARRRPTVPRPKSALVRFSAR